MTDPSCSSLLSAELNVRMCLLVSLYYLVSLPQSRKLRWCSTVKIKSHMHKTSKSMARMCAAKFHTPGFLRTYICTYMDSLMSLFTLNRDIKHASCCAASQYSYFLCNINILLFLLLCKDVYGWCWYFQFRKCA